MVTGMVTTVARWPVKSMAGERGVALRLDRRGIAGDRAHALTEPHEGRVRRLTVRQVPRLLAWSAAYADAPDDALGLGELPLPRLTAPDGTTFRWDDPALPGALAHDLGRPVGLHRDPALQQDLGDSILVTTQASLEALGSALGCTLDLRRFRTNLHVALDAPAFAEEGWEGRRLRVGGTVLDLLHPCARCVIPTRDPDTAARAPEILRWLARERGTLFGINARASGPGRIAVGDPVALL